VKLVLGMGLLAGALSSFAQDSQMKLEYHGAGWVQGGRVEASWDIPNQGNDYKKNWVGQSGVLLTMHTQIDEHWSGTFGLGSAVVQLARGARSQANKWYPFWISWVDEANLAYSTGFWDDGEFKLSLGSFHYGYNSDIKNFGQYLMHGYVYPGTIVTSLTGPLGVNQNLNGAMATLRKGSFSNDLIANIETDDKPLYDISIADVVTWKPASFIELGAGVNLYRLIPANAKATSPGKDCQEAYLGPYATRGQPNACFILDTVAVDGAGNPTRIDTITGSLAGTKLMGRLRLDPKAAFGYDGDLLGKNDLVLYTEVAVLGLKDYPQFYANIKDRIPVMVGFNLPGFGYLDWSVEMEYYGSRNSSDNLAAQNGSWIPVVDDPRVNTKRDNFKYSFNASKLVGGHLMILGQIANDNLRLGGNHDDATGKLALRTPSDWYWNTKIAYFF
jgi:hypothetical protein